MGVASQDSTIPLGVLLPLAVDTVEKQSLILNSRVKGTVSRRHMSQAAGIYQLEVRSEVI